MLKIDACAVNHAGLVRLNNEDNYYLDGHYIPLEKMDQPSSLTMSLWDDRALIAAVCDGMGGAQAGEEASHLAVSALKESLSGFDSVHDTERITDELYDLSRQIDQYRIQLNLDVMGTTIVIACIKQGRLLITNVGDSRAYLMRNGHLSQLSEDHSEVQRMVNMGLISQEDMRTHPRRHVITQYMGMPENDLLIDPCFSDTIDLMDGDRILLCSDGVTDMLEDAAIAKIIQAEPECQPAVHALMNAVLKAGAVDNATALLLQVHEETDTAE